MQRQYPVVEDPEHVQSYGVTWRMIFDLLNLVRGRREFDKSGSSLGAGVVGHTWWRSSACALRISRDIGWTE